MELKNDKSLNKRFDDENDNQQELNSTINNTNVSIDDVKTENVNLQNLYTSDLEQGFSSVSKSDLMNVKKVNESLNVEVETIDLL